MCVCVYIYIYIYIYIYVCVCVCVCLCVCRCRRMCDNYICGCGWIRKCLKNIQLCHANNLILTIMNLKFNNTSKNE